MVRYRAWSLAASTVIALLLGDVTPATAAVTFGGTVSSTGTANRWHALAVTAPMRLVGTLSWSGSANLDLLLYDPNNVRRAAASTSRNPETLVFDADLSGTWRFRVRASSGTASYSLTVSASEIPPPDPAEVGEALTAGIAEDTRTWSANVGDADGDGILDVFLVRHDLPARLYLGGSDGRFRETLVGAFPKNDRHDCDWADVNVDGRSDLYCSLGANRGSGVKQNELWIQAADGTFTPSAAAWGVDDPYGRGRWVTFLDVNHDPYPDLFVGNYFPRTDGIESPDRLFINVDGERFVERNEPALTQELGAYCAVATDWDGDGREDLIICAESRLIIYRNEAGSSFTNVTSSVGVSSFWRTVAVGDVNGDGYLDLAMVKRSLFQVQLQNSSGRFTAPTAMRSLVAGRHVALADWDGDGDADIYVTQGTTSSSSTDITSNAPDLLLLNDGTGAFETASIPLTTRGRGDGAEPIDHDGDGTVAFLVMNGEGDPTKIPARSGPLQLIES